ncbi:folate transporter 1 [Populus alba x Populus x berolinensis]|nr:folate transporter 1 [Populus alba x Populus x berolinensis]
MSDSKWQWENATAGAVAGFATVAAVHPLDVVRTRFQVDDGRVVNLPTYKNTAHAILNIARLEGLKGLYAGFFPAVLGSTVSWGLYFFFYSRAKQRYSKNRDEKLSPGLHLASAAEAGALVCFCTNPIWLVKTRLQLQNPLHQTRRYSGLYDALKTIMREEGWRALYKGIVPSLFLVSHGAVQFTAYEELRKVIVDYKAKQRKEDCKSADTDLLNSVDYAVLGGSSKIAAIILTYPFQVIRSRLQVYLLLIPWCLHIWFPNYCSVLNPNKKETMLSQGLWPRDKLSPHLEELTELFLGLLHSLVYFILSLFVTGVVFSLLCSNGPLWKEFQDIWIVGMS